MPGSCFLLSEGFADQHDAGTREMTGIALSFGDLRGYLQGGENFLACRFPAAVYQQHNRVYTGSVQNELPSGAFFCLESPLV